jgi:hypothetical protein
MSSTQVAGFTGAQVGVFTSAQALAYATVSE